MPVTYASLVNGTATYASELEKGIAQARAGLGKDHPVRIGTEICAEVDQWHEEWSPIDNTLLIGRFGWATAEQTQRALTAASAAFTLWSKVDVAERIDILRRTADRLERDRFVLAGQIVLEAGKTPAEALAEADEAPVFLRLYCDEFERTNGFRTEMPADADNESNVSVMRPYGVWAVISPLNFPLALATGPSAAALVTGNTVVVKPSPAGQLAATMLRDALIAEGLPPSALTVLTGGAEVGAVITSSPLLGGVTFTGSYAVGSAIATALAPHSKPVVAEMGGKNPTIVGASADLDAAAEGIARSAFGYSGQKCSACSRVFVHESVYNELKEKLVERAEAMTVGDPSTEAVSVGPVINAAAGERFTAAVDEIVGAGGVVLAGGTVISEAPYDRGTYVRPTVVEAPSDARAWRDELFLPIVAIKSVSTLEDAIRQANDSDYGLTAGIFTKDEAEIAEFLDAIESSVVYVNRRSGSTTGAWPGRQPISGWKHSGNTGRGTAGPHYLQQYLREQSRTVISED